MDSNRCHQQQCAFVSTTPQPAGNSSEVASNNNPYALFRCCCTTQHTRDHAQLCGVLSLTLFFCLVLISLMLFGAFSLFYIVVGVVVYALLLKCLFGVVEKTFVLVYLLFEAIQIGFHLALLLYIALPLLSLPFPTRKCYYNWTPTPATNASGLIRHRIEICDESQSNYHIEDHFELLLFVAVLLSMKVYFARVLGHFYKYLAWNEKMSTHRAQYSTGRSIQITMDHVFAPASPNFWDNRQHHARDASNNYLSYLPPVILGPPPYTQVMMGQQTATMTGEKTEGTDTGNGGGAQVKEENVINNCKEGGRNNDQQRQQ